jgi:hypothetical protein
VLCRILSSFELLGLALEILGEFHELSSRRIVPRQTMGQPQASFGFVPEICRIQLSIHGRSPLREGIAARLHRCASWWIQAVLIAVTGITDRSM